MVVMGFGLGALLMSKLIAPMLMVSFAGQLTGVFGGVGILVLLSTLPAGFSLRNPPDWGDASAASIVGGDPRLLSVLLSRYCSRGFVTMWLIFFCNIAAGIMLIGFQSPLLQELLRSREPRLSAGQLAGAGATLIGITSLCNGLGRILWGGISDRVGRIRTFRLILGSQIPVLLALMQIRNPWLFGVLASYILLCYGGGFGAMPSFAVEVFGVRGMPVFYGGLLTAWSAAGIVGPQIAALFKDYLPGEAVRYTFCVSALLVTVGFMVACCFRPRRVGDEPTTR
jgi:OFA family oxalate/formate antiporter-like MFS transporter